MVKEGGVGMNLNDLAVEISRREAGKVEVNIAQIKEVLRITLEILLERGIIDLLDTFSRAAKE